MPLTSPPCAFSWARALLSVLVASHVAVGLWILPPSLSSAWRGPADQRALAADGVVDAGDPCPTPGTGCAGPRINRHDESAPTVDRRPDPSFPHHPHRLPRGFAAFGDSYSAGIGTAAEGEEDDCRRGLRGYPALIHDDLGKVGGGSAPRATDFQFLSCTGATTEDVLSGGDQSQIDDFNVTMDADFALLSLGGNDLGFFAVMNACVFRFYSFYSGTCESALAQSAEQIASPDFELRLQMVVREILDRVRWEKRPWFAIAVTGYARFFNADTDECDECSLGVWWRGPKLKKETRIRMNELVLAVNGKIKQSVDFINAGFSRPRVVFVDYDVKFDGHRFCEPAVVEPAYNRTDTWFFHVGGPDNGRHSHNTTDPVPPPPNTTIESMPGLSHLPTAAPVALTLPSDSTLVDPASCLGPAEKSGDWGLLALCYMAMAKHRDPTLRFVNEEVMVQNSMWYVPTYYGKTFHPRSLGHEVIRDAVYAAWHEHNTHRRVDGH